MIKSITVTNYLGESIKLDLARPELSGFAVVNVSGLGPGKATINTTEVSTMDGDLYNSSRLGGRNIVLSLKYLWSPTIEEVRHKSYKYFPLKKEVTLLIETDKRTAEIKGRVESNEPTIFSSNEGAEISIICPSPFFYSAGEDGLHTVIFSGVDSLFEFAFSNESATDDLIQFGSILNKTENVVPYDGDSESGLTLIIHAIGEARNITIYNVSTREYLRLNTDKLASYTGSGIINGDEITICTIKGNKSITLLRDGIETNILNCLEKNVDWFELSKGDNIFAYSAEYGAENLQFKVEYRSLYAGV